MKTILYFQSSLAASNMRELEGVRKYAADEGWKVQVSRPIRHASLAVREKQLA